MRGATILLDCDGVLADFQGTLLRRLAGFADVPAEFKTFSLKENLTPEQYKAAKEILTRTRFALEVERIAGSAEAVDWMRGKGAEVFVVTSPYVENETWEHDRRSWLMQHFGIDEDHIISTTAKHLVHGDVFVDDRPKHVFAWRNRRSGSAFLFNQPHNRDVAPKVFARLDGWTRKETMEAVSKAASGLVPV